MERRLAAILAADAVGYSRLMEQDEAGTLAALKAHRKELIDPKIAEHRGRLVKLMGDGALVEFASVVDAVRCAVDIQKAMAQRNAEAPIERKIEFRIGINLGDVIVEGQDIYGDGVNVAARLEELARPGGVCISGDAYRQVRNKVDIRFTDIGEQQVKNMAEPIRVYRIEIGPVEPGAARTGPLEPMYDRPAVAVLPFTNMSGDPEQEYFSDGLTEDIITALAAWRSFPVISRNSTFAYKGQSPDVRKVASDLGARYVLEGSVRKAGMRLRITTQLIDASTGHHVWAEKFDRALEDIFDIQDDITRRIAATIAPELEQAELKKSMTKKPESLTAWDCYLRGASYLHEFTREGNAKARDMFQRAIKLDPTYSQAFAALGRSHLRDILLEYTSSREDSLAKVFEAARRAAALDDTSSDAHVTLAQAYMWRDQHDLAIAETKRAMELNPYDAETLHSLGNRLDLAGESEEGIAKMELAQNLSAQERNSHMCMAFLARAYVNARQYERAVEFARNAVHRRPESPHAYFILAIGLGHLDRCDEARAALKECERVQLGFVRKRSDWRPYRGQADNEHLLDGLRKAGLAD